jgi:hypothetical protein
MAKTLSAKAAQHRYRHGPGRAIYLRAIRNAHLKRQYEITVDEYNEMLANQHGVCAICNTTCPSFDNLAVDHNHATGKVRGLLCKPCNTGLGAFKDRPDLLNLAIIYLEANRGNF